MQDNLHELIQSLSRSEKRYFTINGGNDDTDHMRMFGLVSSMKEFDENKLKKAFPRNLSWKKGDLYKLILKNMRTYPSDKSAYLEIKELLIDAQFLIDRGLFEQSLTLLKKAKKKATSYHRLNDLLEISRLTQVSLLKMNSNGVTELMEKLTVERKNILKNLEEEITYANANLSLEAKFLQQITLSTEEDKKALAEEYHFLTSVKYPDIQTIRGQIYYLRANKTLAHLLGHHKDVYDFCEKIVNWWENNPMIKKEENHLYLNSLFNLIAACSYMNHINRIPEIIEQLERLKPNNLMEKTLLFKKVLHYKILYLMNIGSFNEAKTTFLLSEKSLSKFNLDTKWKTMMIANFAILLFVLEDFRDCIQWIDNILENKNVKKRQKVQQVMRLIKCICYSELDDVEGFESTYRSTNAFFVAVKLKKSSFEFTILKYLNRIENASFDIQKKEQEALFEFLKKEEKKPGNKLLPGLQEYLLWIESKLTGVSITDLCRKNLRGKN